MVRPRGDARLRPRAVVTQGVWRAERTSRGSRLVPFQLLATAYLISSLGRPPHLESSPPARGSGKGEGVSGGVYRTFVWQFSMTSPYCVLRPTFGGGPPIFDGYPARYLARPVEPGRSLSPNLLEVH